MLRISMSHEEYMNLSNREEKKKMKREEVLPTAEKMVCGHREQDYGSPEDNFKTIAALWSGYKHVDFSSVDVSMMVALMKIARISTGTGTDDSFVDLAGYAACGAECKDNSDLKKSSFKLTTSLLSLNDCRVINRFCKEILSNMTVPDDDIDRLAQIVQNSGYISLRDITSVIGIPISGLDYPSERYIWPDYCISFRSESLSRSKILLSPEKCGCDLSIEKESK